ncbi:hypothetical protein JWG42_18850, partial [Desulfoprunum benzoelyticum]|uniref:hypothetical protein n=1 Tax=Desulfoprunum benzoelyticum TaxID=1506996 RepID=UPI001964CED2
LIGPEDVQNVFQAVPKFLYAFFDVHKSERLPRRLGLSVCPGTADPRCHRKKPKSPRMREHPRGHACASALDFFCSPHFTIFEQPEHG